ncbi:MAG TPA: hypothetical protein VK594_23570 [Streptosporangiaceae bacterium]|nr:hypothetical protein [Streptosporangiaceae bacterium]
MARAGRTEPDSVSIWLKLSAEDAARMTQVLTRPEFAGWTRAEWCLEMIQTALGYYTRPRPAESAPAEEAEPAEPEPAGSVAPEPVPDAPGPVPDAPEPVADEPEPPVQADCPHPADARDYQSGTCGACGAILWD